MREKPATPFLGTTRSEGWVVVAAAIPVSILVGVLTTEDQGWITGDAVGALGCLVTLSWPLRRERWFWAAMACFAAVNAFGVFHFDWSFTHDWSGHALISLALADLAVMAAIIYGLYCLIYGTPAESIAELPDEGPSYSERDLDL